MKTQSIQFRISSAILLILVTAVGISIYLTTANQRENLLDSTQKTLAINTEMLNLTIRNIMLSGEAPIANNTIADIRGISEFSEFSLYRSDGTTAFSDYETLENVNSYRGEELFERTPRTEKRILDHPAFRQVLRTNSPVVNLDRDKREMEYFFPILNFADCRVCHGEENFIRGISHFRISIDGIYAQVRQAGLFLSLFFSTVGAFLFFWLTMTLRRIIIRPVLLIGGVVSTAATGDLSVQVELERSDELGELGGRINQMIAGLKERNELQIQNKVIETRFRENRKYLDNINEGLLMVDREGRITDQYSRYLTAMFETEDPAGQALGEFLFPGEERRELRRELEQFLHLLFTNRTADMDMIMSINPLDEVSLKINRKKTIVLHADFQKILKEGETENVMVIFEDRTDLLRTREELEQQKRQRESEVAQIAAILKVGPEVFEGFIREAWKTFRELQDNLDGLEERAVLDRLFRNIHSVKGSARYLDYHRIEELAHQVEDILAERREQGARPDLSVRETLERLLEELFFQMEGVEALIERFREFSSVRGAAEGGKSPDLAVFEDRVGKMAAQLAGDLEKEVAFSLENPLKDLPALSRLQAPLFHLLRNALDHGIEDPLERLSSGKPREARLSLRFRREGEELIAEVEDDGRGIDLERIRALGVERGLIRPEKAYSPARIAGLLFQPGFSSREQADTLSGRGVGLDAVREELKALGGRISLATKEGRGTRFILTLPFREEDE